MTETATLPAAGTLLEVRGIHLRFDTYRGRVHALNGVDLMVRPGEIVGLVGETGSGKSVTGHAILNCIRPPGRIVEGEVRFRGRNLLELGRAEIERVRGREIALIAQSPRASLNPLFTVGDVFATYVAVHEGIRKPAAYTRAADMLVKVGIPDPRRVLAAYPHELSTGMCQRVMIAMALSCRPALLIADEPTTGIDVTLQVQILGLVADLVRGNRTATILITHDLGVVAELCDRVAVMYAGRIVEDAPVDALFADPRHPYTQGLIASTLRVDEPRPVYVMPGGVPDLLAPPRGCAFAPRCSLRQEICRTVDPPSVPVSPRHSARCHFADRTTEFAAVTAAGRPSRAPAAGQLDTKGGTA